MIRHIVSSVVLLFILTTIKAQTYKFDFGPGKVEAGYTQVLPDMVYNPDRGFGFGFDYGTAPQGIDRGGSDALTSDFCSGTAGFYFSVTLPEGTYDVKITMGDIKGESVNTVKAESRRLMIEKLVTRKGKTETQTITVNVRTPKINDTESIHLKPREVGYLNWDNKLTLEFNNSRPCVCAVEITKIEPKVTIYLAGNSTVVDQDKEPWAAWGQMITRFFKPDVSIANYAESGEALNTFLSAKRLEKIMSLIKPGDYLFIEFGHNDMKQHGPGIGPWESYTNYLKQYVEETRKKGAIPVLVTSMNRRTFDSTGHIYNSFGDYPDAMRKVAKDENVKLIDLNAMSKVMYEVWGPENSVKAFVHYPANSFPGQDKPLADNTHFNAYGAYELAKCILQGIKDDKLDIAKYITDDFTGFDPAHPDPMDTWSLPYSPMASNSKPDGN